MNTIQSGPTYTEWLTDGFKGTGNNPGPNGPKTGFLNTGGASIGLFEPAVQDSAGTIRVFDSWAGTATTTNCEHGGSIRAITEERRTDRFSSVPGDATASKVARRHFEGFNALFGDGHVKFRRWGTTKANEWSIQSDDEFGKPL